MKNEFNQRIKIFLPKIVLPATYLLVFTLFSFRAFYYLDPDFGWHIKIGELIFKKGFPQKDPFSYSMPSFQYVNHEWLTNVVTYLMYTYLPFVFLPLLFALLPTIVIKLHQPKNVNKLLAVPIILLSSSILIPFFGIRPQVVTWLMFGMLLKVFYDKKLFKKYISLLPLFFIAWVNLHGGFAVGLAIFVVFFLINSFTTRTFSKKTLLYILLCIMATFINPYFGRIWYEEWLTFSDLDLRFIITEWMPLFYKAPFLSRIDTLVIFSIWSFFVFAFRRKLNFCKTSISLIMLIAALLSRRHLPLFIISSLSMLLNYSSEAYQKISIHKKRINLRVVWLFIILILGVYIFSIRTNFQKTYSSMESFKYPKQAIEALSAVPLEGEIFNYYSWGGYLIWKLPQKKVFIDGRMLSWKWQAPTTESNSAFEDYLKVVDGKLDLNNYFDKYNISIVIWPTLLFNDARADQTADLISNPKFRSPFLNRLMKSGWRLYYSDFVSLIFIRHNPQIKALMKN